MTRKIIAIFAALLIAASLCACNNGNNETEETTGNKIDINGSDENDTNEDSNETNKNNSSTSEIGDPGEYSYTQCNETVYVNNPNSALTLRSAEYEDMGSIPHGTALTRTGVSTDEDNYWSKVTYEGETYYVASKFITDVSISNPDEGFEPVNKTVVVNKQTGSLNIRNLPTKTGSIVIGYAQAGENIKVVAENTTSGWYKVEFVAYDSTTPTYGYIKSGADNFESVVDNATAEQ